MDASLPFGQRWAAASCQDATLIITSHLNRQGLSLVVYINDFGKVAQSKHLAEQQLKEWQGTLGKIGLVVAKHKAIPRLNK